jgi:hypothetical protein
LGAAASLDRLERDDNQQHDYSRPQHTLMAIPVGETHIANVTTMIQRSLDWITEQRPKMPVLGMPAPPVTDEEKRKEVLGKAVAASMNGNTPCGQPKEEVVAGMLIKITIACPK